MIVLLSTNLRQIHYFSILSCLFRLQKSIIESKIYTELMKYKDLRNISIGGIHRFGHILILAMRCIRVSVKNLY